MKGGGTSSLVDIKGRAAIKKKVKHTLSSMFTSKFFPPTTFIYTPVLQPIVELLHYALLHIVAALFLYKWISGWDIQINLQSRLSQTRGICTYHSPHHVWFVEVREE